jgi:hypothetical protein
MELLTKNQILSALRRLGELAKEAHIELELSIYGGCAMLLAFDRRAITRDVDAIFHPLEETKPLIAQVAKEMNLPDEWLNDDVKELKDTHKNSSKCLTDGRMVNKKARKDANCSKNSRGCGPCGSVSLYFPLRTPCVSMRGR